MERRGEKGERGMQGMTTNEGKRRAYREMEREADKEGEFVCRSDAYPCDAMTVALVSTARRVCEFNHDQCDKVSHSGVCSH